jgi:hypothetical protein
VVPRARRVILTLVDLALIRTLAAAAIALLAACESQTLPIASSGAPRIDAGDSGAPSSSTSDLGPDPASFGDAFADRPCSDAPDSDACKGCYLRAQTRSGPCHAALLACDDDRTPRGCHAIITCTANNMADDCGGGSDHGRALYQALLDCLATWCS